MDLLYPIDYKLIGKKFHFFDCDNLKGCNSSKFANTFTSEININN